MAIFVVFVVTIGYEMAKCVCICLGGFVVAQGNLSLSSCHCNCSLFRCVLFTPGLFPLWASWHKTFCAYMLLLPDKQVLWWRESWVRLGFRNKSLTPWTLNEQIRFSGQEFHRNSQKQSRRSLAWIKKEQGSLSCISASWTRAQHA